jgi:Na+/H+-dicarboxylate symporter
MYDRTGNYLIVAILIGMILGVIAVALFGEAILPVKFLGNIFLNALKMVVIPLLFCSMIVGITKLGDVRKLGKTGGKTLSYFLATSSISVAIGLILVNIIQPGVGFGIFSSNVPEIVQNRESYSFLSWLSDQIPYNIMGAAAETKGLPIGVFALFFGGVLTTIGSKGRPVIAFFEGLNEAIMKIVHIIMWFAPIGIFGLVAGQLAAQGGLGEFGSVLSALGKYSLVVILGLLLHGVVVLPLLLKFIGGKNPIEYFVGMSQALTTAFATASSSATLPVTMDCVEEKNDIDKRSSSFVLPLGATINMDGTALYEAVAAMFIAQAYGIDLTILQQVVIFATAVLASIGAAGIPEAGLVTMVLVLQAVGLPLEGIGLILAIDWFLDRCRTSVNVWGDSIGAAVIATTAEIGLVDRRKPASTGSPRASRIKSFSRRDDSRSKRIESIGKGRERTQARGKTPDAGPKPRRSTAKSAKKGDRPTERRTQRRERQTTESRNAPSRRDGNKRPERPTMEPKAESKSRMPVKEKTPDTRKEKSVPRKPAFGRKRITPNHAAKKGKIEKAQSDRGTQIVEKTVTEFPEQVSAFEIPKFPEKILDELVSPENEHDGPDIDMGMATDEGRDKESVLNEKTSLTPESTDRQNAEPSPEKFSVDADSVANIDYQMDEGNSSEEFSRMDEMILGSSENSELDEKESSSPARPEKSPVDTSEDTAPIAESDPKNEPEPDIIAKSDEPDTTPTEIAGDEIKSDSVILDDISAKVDSPAIDEDQSVSDDTMESGSPEKSESTEAEDSEESMQWGRQKNKRMNR